MTLGRMFAAQSGTLTGKTQQNFVARIGNKGENYHLNCCRISDDEQLLLAFQGSPLWGMKGLPMNTSLYSPSTKAWEDKHAALSNLEAVRGMSAQSLAQYVEANATKRFTWPIYWKALKKGYAQSSPYNIQVPSFY